VLLAIERAVATIRSSDPGELPRTPWLAYLRAPASPMVKPWLAMTKALPRSIVRHHRNAPAVKRERRGRLGQMSPSEITGRMNERDFPHLVELELPPGGETEPRRGLRGLDICNGNQSTTISAVRISTASIRRM
jgi:hypothetical protein